MDIQRFKDTKLDARTVKKVFPDIGRVDLESENGVEYSGPSDPENKKSPSIHCRYLFSEAPPVFEFRHLTAFEIGHAQDVAARDKQERRVLEMLEEMAGSEGELFKALGEPGRHLATRVKVEMVRQACVSPKLDVVSANKLARDYPIDFLRMYQIVETLNCLGGTQAAKKPPNSGETQK